MFPLRQNREGFTVKDAPEACSALNPECLRQWPLPMPDREGDKEERGRLLVVAGAREMPGAALLAAEAALRAGAGKVTVATCASIAASVALAIPESRVIALPETAEGSIRGDAADRLAHGKHDAILIGPGMQDEDEVRTLTEALGSMFAAVAFVLDAYAMSVVRHGAHGFEHRALVTPHAGEMAHLRGMDKD